MSLRSLFTSAARVSLLSAAVLLGCEEIPEYPVKDTCASTADCPLSQVCDRVAQKCISEPQAGVIGSFACAGVDAEGNGYPAGRIGTSQVLGYVTLPKELIDQGEDATRRLSLIAKSACAIKEGFVILSFEDPSETLAEDSDSYRLTVYVPLSSIAVGSPTPIQSALLERYVDADQKRRDFSFIDVNPGVVIFDAQPAVGQLVPGYINVNGLTMCKNDGGDCYKPPVQPPEIAFPDEADPSDSIGDDTLPDEGTGGAGGEDGAGGESGAGGEGGEGGAGGAGGDGAGGAGGDGAAGDGAGGDAGAGGA